jgi:ArsR family transcriptional regulator
MARNAAAAASMLKQIANEQRLRILCALAEGEASVGDIARHSNLSQSALSQHLAKMREAGLIAATKRGRRIYYRLSSIEARALLATLHLIYCRA